VNRGEGFEFLTQFAMSGGRVGPLGLRPLAVDLEGGFGDIDSDIDGGGGFFHIADRVLTHSYGYELLANADALATVRVLSTGRVRLKLDYGLV